jgi:uncharacterized protein DUF4126
MTAEQLGTLGLAAGVSVASGIRVYATIAVLGLLDRLDVLALPPALEPLSHPAIIAIATALYVAEFVADKVPAFDSVWDAIHTFIRVPAAAVLAFAMLGDVAEPWRSAAALLGGTVALSAHGLKAGTRLAANTSPEPFSNWLLSFGEDFAVAGILWMAARHPLLSLLVAVSVVLAAVLSVQWVLGTLRRLLRRQPVAGT